jgi:hypothetical protein
MMMSTKKIIFASMDAASFTFSSPDSVSDSAGAGGVVA